MNVVEIAQMEWKQRPSPVRSKITIVRGATYFALAALLLVPASVRARADANAPSVGVPSAAQAAPQEQEQSRDDRQDQDQEKRDREQEARDREQEKRDREQEKRDREQERAERNSELYDAGREALDEDRYDRAESKFEELAALNGPQTDAALYWKAYAENRLGKRDTALATIADLKHRFPQSRWLKDASAVGVDGGQPAGQPH